MLICFVGVLVGLDVLILLLAAAIPQSRVHGVLSQSSDKPSFENVCGCVYVCGHVHVFMCEQSSQSSGVA